MKVRLAFIAFLLIGTLAAAAAPAANLPSSPQRKRTPGKSSLRAKPKPAAPTATASSPARPREPSGLPSIRVLATDQMAIRVPEGRIECVPPRTGRDVPGPILGVRGPDGVWRGAGWVEGTAPVIAIDGGSEGDEYVVTYAFAQGGRAEIRFAIPETGDHLAVSEECSDCTNTWVLSFAEEFRADRVWAKPTEADEYTGLRRVRPTGQIRHGRLVFWSQFGRILDLNDRMGVFGGKAERDFVGFLRIHSDRWTRPGDNFLSLWERDGNLRLEGNWRKGRREWLLAATSRTGETADDARQRILAIERKWVWTRDGWTLEWDEPLPQYRPNLTESEQRDKDVVLAELDRLATLLDARGYLAPPDTRPFVPVYKTYGKLRELGVLRPDEDRRARRAVAMLAHNCFSKDIFPWDRLALPPGSPDGFEPLFRGLASATFDAERCAIVGDIGLILRSP